MSIQPHNKKSRKRERKIWSERDEKALFILQMTLGTKFQIIKNFLKDDKSINDIKNLFYSKLRTYLKIQISNLKSEKCFIGINPNIYDIKNVFHLIIKNKIPTMYLNKNAIKKIIMEQMDKQINKKDENRNSNDNEQKIEKCLLKKKRRKSNKKGNNIKIKKENEEINNIKLNIIKKENDDDESNKYNINRDFNIFNEFYNLEENENKNTLYL